MMSTRVCTTGVWFRILLLGVSAFVIHQDIPLLALLTADSRSTTTKWKLSDSLDAPLQTTGGTKLFEPADDGVLENQTLALPSQINFHIHAYTTIRAIVTEDSILSWGYKRSKGYPPELRLKSVLKGLGIVRLHEYSNEEKRSVWTNHTASPYLWESNICDAIQHIGTTTTTQQSSSSSGSRSSSSRPHVLFVRCGENAGDFSRHVPDHKTINWDHKLQWTRNGCQSDQQVYDYLENNDTRAVFTTQHHIFDHPKVHSLPLGVKFTMKYEVLKRIQQPRVRKTKLLMINDNGWKHRKNITATIIRTFLEQNQTIANTYNNRKSSQYLNELQQSMFILAPSGLGWDCYRIWEALYMNTIPIMERYHRPYDGWRRTLDELPVVWVEEFSEVTPELLRDEYQRIAANGDSYTYQKLTNQWWVDFARSKMDA